MVVYGSLFLLAGCSSIQSVGKIGPKKLNIFAISSSDFLSANRTIVILDEKGNVIAYTGGTVTGPGTVGMQALGTVASAASVYYGSEAIKRGLQNSNVNIKGIPSDININTDNVIEIGKKKK